MPQTLDLSGWPRRHHFRFFLDFEQPQFQLTSLIDVTALDAAICKHGGSRFAAMLHATMWATQAEEALRMRIRWSGSVPEVVLHEVVHPSFTAPVQLPESDRGWPGCDLPLFGYTTARYGPDFVGFAQRVRAAQERVVHDADVDRQAAQDSDDLVFVSSIPWMSFTGLQHAMKHARTDSMPRITWGRFMGSDGRVEVSVSLQAHHGLADGGHVARWFRRLQARLEQPEWVFATRLPQDP